MPNEHTVLFVDDEVNILKALQRLFRIENMNVLCASRASEALELLERHPQLQLSPPEHPTLQPMLTPEGYLRTWTHLHGTDSFFAARFQLMG